jgi:L-methionine (R)-S-oxide reductase
VPMMVGDQVIGVLDLDSPSPNRFDHLDREGCEKLVSILIRHIRAD